MAADHAVDCLREPGRRPALCFRRPVGNQPGDECALRCGGRGPPPRATPPIAFDGEAGQDSAARHERLGDEGDSVVSGLGGGRLRAGACHSRSSWQRHPATLWSLNVRPRRGTPQDARVGRLLTSIRTTAHRRAPSIGFDRSPYVERSTTERTVRACWTTCQAKPQITVLDRTPWTPEAALPR